MELLSLAYGGQVRLHPSVARYTNLLVYDVQTIDSRPASSSFTSQKVMPVHAFGCLPPALSPAKPPQALKVTLSADLARPLNSRGAVAVAGDGR
eukprot:scaffold449973_cov26-Prasinocladus_malaysianus.AAC.1